MGGVVSCISALNDVRKLGMEKSKNPPQNAVGTTHGVLRNTEGTLKGRYGTVGGLPSKPPKNAKK